MALKWRTRYIALLKIFLVKRCMGYRRRCNVLQFLYLPISLKVQGKVVIVNLRDFCQSLWVRSLNFKRRLKLHTDVHISQLRIIIPF